MPLISTIYKPDSTLHAVYAKLISKNEYHLVTAKNSSIDIYSITSNGLVLIESLPVYGQIESLITFQPTRKGGSNDWIFFSLTDGTCYVVCYSNGKFISFKSAEVENKTSITPVNSTLIHQTIIDPTGSYIAIYMTVGYINLFRISKKSTEIISKPSKVYERGGESNQYSLDNVFEKSNIIAPVDFINIESMIFVPGMKSPTLAIIHNQQESKRTGSFYNISILTIDSSGSKLTSRNNWKNIDISKYHLIIPVSEPLGGFILVGTNSLIYCKGSDKLRNGQGNDSLDNITVDFIQSIDDNEQLSTFTEINFNRFLIGSQSGKLYLLHLHVEENMKISSCQLVKVGETSPTTQLLHLSSNYFFASSHSSLSILFQLDIESKRYPCISIIQELENLAPIVDFIVDNDFNGNSAIITCSGGYYGSSIKKIEYSYQVDNLIEVELEASEMDLDINSNVIKSIWQIDNKIILGYLSKSRILSIDDDGDFSELNDYKGINLQVYSLFIGKFNDTILQVTENEISLPELAKSYSYPNISFASVSSNNYLSICTDRKSIIIFDNDLNITHSHTFDDFISSLALNNEGTSYSITFWNSSKLFIIENKSTYNILYDINLQTNSLARSLLFLTNEIILVGMADGTLFIYNNNNLLDRFIIGDEPLSLYPFNNNVIAVSNEVVILQKQSEIYGKNKYFTIRMNCEIPIALSPFSNDSFGAECIIFVTGKQLKVAKTNLPSYICTQEKKLDGEFARRISQNNNLGVSMVGTIENNSKGSTLHLIETSTFNIIDSFALDKGELCENILSISSNLIEYEGFIIGTSIDDGNPDQPLSTGKGRILLFSIDSESRRLKLEHELNTIGSIFKIELISEKLTTPTIRFLITVQSKIKELLLSRISNGSFQLEVINETLQSSTIPLFISSLDEQVVVGELLRKVTLGEYSPSNSLSNILTCAGGYWQSNVVLVKRNEILIADNEFNLMLVKATTIPSLEISSGYHLGELVNQIRRLEGGNRWSRLFNCKELTGIINPIAVIGTASGGLYLYSEIDSLEQSLATVRDNIIENCKTINAPLGGEEGVKLYHKSRTISEDLFIDGDILKLFSTNLSKYEKDKVLRDVNIPINLLQTLSNNLKLV